MVTDASDFGTLVPVRFSAVSGRSYTCKYRTVFPPSYSLRPVTPQSVHIAPCIHRRLDTLSVDMSAGCKYRFIFPVAERGTTVIRVVAVQHGAVPFIEMQRNALLYDVLPRPVHVGRVPLQKLRYHVHSSPPSSKFFCKNRTSLSFSR